jgi:hypothetical protein
MELTTREDGEITILTVTGDLVIGEPETTFKKTITRLLEEAGSTCSSISPPSAFSTARASAPWSAP